MTDRNVTAAEPAAPVFIDAPEELTTGFFTGLLRAATVLDPWSSVVSVRLRPFGTGQLSRIVIAELTYDRPGDAPGSVVVKLPSADATSRVVAVAFSAYEAEVCFYRDISPQLGVCVPDVFYAEFDPGGHLTLVLEHLHEEWFPGDAVAGGTLDQARAAIDQLVALQVPSWTAQMPARNDWLTRSDRTQRMFDYVPSSIGRFRRRFGHRLDRRHLQLLERLAPHAPDYPRRAWRPPFVLSHCDFRVDNMLFKQAPDGLSAAVIDWQLVRLGPPMIDMSIYLASSLHPDLRRAHQDELLHRYHRGLIEGGVVDFSFEDCLENLRTCSLYPLLGSISGAVAVEQTERGDEMIARTVTQAAELVIDFDAEEIVA